MIRNGLVLTIFGIVAILLAFGRVTPAAADNVIVVTTTDDVVNGNDGQCSLREAILAANNNSIAQVGECAKGSGNDTDVIQLEGGETYNLTIAGANEEFAQTGDLDIIDNATPEVDIMVQGVGGTAVVQINIADRVWHIHEAGLVLDGVQTTNGNTTQGGGLYNDNGQVTLNNALFTLNTATSGGAIFSKGANADLRLNNVEISRNLTNNFGSGAGIYNDTGMLVVIDSNITGNMSMGSGGGLLNKNASATLTRTRVSGNETGDCGGGIANIGIAAMTLIDSEITGGNKSDGAGAGICNKATLSVTLDTLIAANEAAEGGGGIYNSGSLTVRNSLIENNLALDPNAFNTGLGGGLYAVENSTTTIIQSAVVNNNAATVGGGIVMDGTLIAFNNTISDNFGISTGGILVQEHGEATLVNVTMADNEVLAGFGGTGLHVVNGTAVLGNSIVANTTQGFDTCKNAGGTITSLGNNLGDDDTCFGEPSDIIDSDPLLAPLADGIREPMVGSPVVDAADPVMCSETAVASTDQIGQTRPMFNGCDIGAIEWTGMQVFLPVIIK